ncbi:Spy0128 family protein [Microbacterium protaetiae]|uniref:DUF7927 domain-containing protein n=1 Tax=Microbacterium protaetiae TaxID=2509458 RepID=UPI0013EA2FDD|nr:FctA domain-containing protein [Microbacterium protaetiae]
MVLSSGLVWVGASAAQAADPVPPTPGGVTPDAQTTDYASWHRYPGALADENDYTHLSQNPGRIWTDKSVFEDDAEATTDGVDHDLNIASDEMAVTLSALGTTRQVTSTRKPVIDLVLVLDNSYSMTYCVGTNTTCVTNANYTNSRASAMVDGVNAAIKHIVAADPDAKVSMVAFGTGARELTPLAKPVQYQSTGNYLALTHSGSTMTLRFAGGTLQVGTSPTQSTNIQRGIDQARSVLADQNTKDVAGDVQHIPSVIVFSDGEPTFSANETNWWNLTGTANLGTGSPGATQFFGNGFLAALSAAYLKNQVDDIYNNEAYNTAHGFAPVETNIYTVGLGMGALSTQGQQLAYATLNPLGTLPDEGTTGANPMANSFATAMSAYRKSGTATLLVSDTDHPPVEFTITRPGGNTIWNGQTNVNALNYDPTYTELKYNTTFDAPNTASELITVFERIASQVLEDEPTLPIETTSPDPNTDGYVTFTDPLGDYMHVTKMDSIVFCSLLADTGPGEECTPESFTTQKKGETVNNVTTYTASGSYKANDIFPATDLSNIIITVETNTSLAVGDIVTVKIPVALLPMVNTKIVEDADGNPLSMNWFNSHPVHVYYKVAPKEGVAAAVTDPTSLSTADQQALATYIATNTTPDGAVRFYANAFTQSGATRTSQAYATFRPSTRNDFYRFAQDSYLYSAENTGSRITQEDWDGLDDDAIVYRTITAYSTKGAEGSKPDKTTIFAATTKGDLLAGQTGTITIRALDDGYMIAPAGLYNLSDRTTNLDMPKCADDDVVWENDVLSCSVVPTQANRTGTDDYARQTRLAPTAAQQVQVRLGNNGWLEYNVPGAFEIAKTVTKTNASLSPDVDQKFTFEVTMTSDGTAALPGEFPYHVFTTAGESVESGTVASGGTVAITANQFVRVMGLPDGARFSVDEQGPPTGYTSQPPTPTGGTIAAPLPENETIPRIPWGNTYSASSVTTATVTAAKNMDPNWVDGTYTMQLCRIDNAPLPGGVEGSCVNANAPGQDQAFGFGNVTFEVPGTFTYSLAELKANVAGVQDSLAEYRWTVTVKDNGHGALVVDSTSLRQVADDAGHAVDVAVAAPATFTNTFTPGDRTGALEIVKRVRDSSLTSPDEPRPPRIPYRFTFSAVQQAGGSAPDLLFEDGTDEAQVAATADSVTVPSPLLTYTHEHVGNAYYYKAQEDDFDSPISGLQLSDAVWFFRINVVLQNNAILPAITVCHTTVSEVTTTNPWGECDPSAGAAYTSIDTTEPLFTNVYTPAPAQAVLTATKTIDGRDWSGDSFTFALSAADDDTGTAITEGDVVMPTTLTTTATAGDTDNVKFDAISFSKQGTYSFAVKETTPSTAHLTTDPNPVVYTVVVTSDVDENGLLTGSLTATVSITDEGSASFVNTYRNSVSYANVVINKTLTGRDLDYREFSFVVQANDNARDILGWTDARQVYTNPTAASDGVTALVAQLPEINFDQDDIGKTYTFEIQEQQGDLGGITYDDTTYTVTIQPRYDAENDEMWVHTSVSDGAGTAQTYDSRTDGAAVIDFANTYEAGPGTAHISFDKRIVGRDWRAGDTFSFQLSPVDGAPMPATDTVDATTSSTTASPGIRVGEFGPITYTEAGDYEYEIRETTPGDDSMITDDSVLTVTVHVTDDGSGTLQTEVSQPNTIFENTYLATYHYDILKRLVGRDMTDGEFQVRVVPEDAASGAITGGQVPYPDGAVFSMPGAADGVFAQVQREAALVLTSEALGNTYCYIYSEVVPGTPEPGIIYDTTRFEICTTPSMNEDGTYRATSVIKNADTDDTLSTVVTNEDDAPMQFPQIAFENTFNSWTLTKSSDPVTGSTVKPGQTVTYTLTATNTATSMLSGAQAVDDLSDVLSHASLGDLPDGLVLDGTNLTWTIPDLAQGDSATVSYTVTVDADAVGVTLRNSVTGAGDVPDPEACPTDDPDCRTSELFTPRWTLTKSSDPDSGSTVVPGDTITYTLTAGNASDDADLTGAVAEDDLSDVLPYATLGDLPDGVTRDGTTLRWAIPDLSPGENVTVSYTVTVTAAAAGQTLRNVVTGAGDVPDPDSCPTADPQCRETEHLVPSWTLAKTADPASGSAVRPGDDITYTLTATNTGPAPLSGATATDDLSGVLNAATLGDLPDGLALAADGTSLVWTIPDLAVGEDASVSYTATVNDGATGTTLRNAVSGTGPIDPTECTTDDPCTTEHPVPAWTLTKSSDPVSGSTVQPGDEVTYTLTATNTASTTLSGAQAVDDLSDVLSHASLGDLPDGLVLDGTNLTWTIPDLAQGDSATVSYTVTVDADAVGVTLRNSVTGAGDVPDPEVCPTDDPDCRTSELFTPRWTLTKSSDPDSGSTVVPGDTITYTLTAGNASDDADLTGAVAEDDLSDVLPYATLGDLPDGVTRDGTTLRWAIPDLSPGEDVTVSYTVTVTAAAAGQTLRNVVTGAGDVPDPDSCPTADPQCRETEHLVPSWTLAKTADPASGSAVRPGDDITYTLTATNTGPAPLSGATATDDLSGVLNAATLGDLPAGLTRDGTTLTWDIPTIAVGEAASVSYTVTVNEGVWGTTLRNAVAGTGPVDPSTCADDCTTEHPVPLWTLRKTSDPASGSQVDPGSTIAYTLTVLNDGPAPVAEATVTDDLSQVLNNADLVEPLPAGLTLSGTTLTWHVPALAVGEQVSVTYRVTVHSGAYDVTLRNTATAGPGGGCDGTCTTDHSTPPQGELPITGGTIAWSLGALGATLVIAGGVLLYIRRRRDELV